MNYSASNGGYSSVYYPYMYLNITLKYFHATFSSEVCFEWPDSGKMTLNGDGKSFNIEREFFGYKINETKKLILEDKSEASFDKNCYNYLQFAKLNSWRH